MLCTEIVEIQKICHKNDLRLWWVLRMLNIDRVTFYRWKEELQVPTKDSLKKLEKGLTFLRSLENLINECSRENSR